jgi:hypothetical protein
MKPEASPVIVSRPTPTLRYEERAPRALVLKNRFAVF